MLGILLVNKPRGITSHDAVAEVRKRLGTRRVGHAGTLDPIGTGLLVMAVGPATRFLRYLPTEPKEYIGEMTLGVATDTQDAEGQTVAERDPSGVTLDALRDAAACLIGEIEQIPPMHSAAKVGGQRLYKLARQGVEVARRPKRVNVAVFEIHDVHLPIAIFKLVCSGGTYVRTLTADLGERLGVGAHLSALTRSAVGRFRLEHALELSEVSAEAVIPLVDALSPLPMVRLTRQQAVQARHGQAVSSPLYEDEKRIGLLDAEGSLLGVASRTGNAWHPECVIPMEALQT